MNTLIITYELNNSKEDYPKLSNKIKSYDGWAKPFNRTWFIKSSKKASIVRDELNEEIGGRGKIVVINVSGAAWGTLNVSCEVNAWLHENI